MADGNGAENGTAWGGASVALVGAVSGCVLVFTTDPINTAGVLTEAVLTVIGLTRGLSSRVSSWGAGLDRRWRGVGWILLGFGVGGFGAWAAPTSGQAVNGLVVGLLLSLYGGTVAFNH